VSKGISSETSFSSSNSSAVNFNLINPLTFKRTKAHISRKKLKFRFANVNNQTNRI